MSSPTFVVCVNCRKKFLFVRGSLEKCPNCGEEYSSHRDKEEKTNAKMDK